MAMTKRLQKSRIEAVRRPYIFSRVCDPIFMGWLSCFANRIWRSVLDENKKEHSLFPLKSSESVSDCRHGRRKGRQGSPWILKISAKKGCFLSFQ